MEAGFKPMEPGAPVTFPEKLTLRPGWSTEKKKKSQLSTASKSTCITLKVKGQQATGLDCALEGGSFMAVGDRAEGGLSREEAVVSGGETEAPKPEGAGMSLQGPSCATRLILPPRGALHLRLSGDQGYIVQQLY